ncbi:MAG: glycosyltransferase family 4 protein [Gemmatimonadetes bacterium]|jgi:glycosyltransferase involved in cell wall biosynthesis|nr:glycosyltransferase family 4 protein [Gemmatimonadota bacterium]MBT7862706.1 glycosyltransferase family 4 protein [Gemmatimonadota bacterium]
MATLLFILADRLSLLADKGEMTARYYNPGDVFDDVHLLTTSNDLVDPARIAITAGRARLHVHRLWQGDDRVNMALSPVLAGRWARRAIDLARRIDIDAVRTGDRVTGYLGARISEEIGVPHVLSLHADREDHLQRLGQGPHRWLMKWELRYARYAMPRADTVIAVYESLRTYAAACGARNVEVVYNAICPTRETAKQDYGLAAPPRVVSVGRQIRGKEPLALIRAFQDLDARLVLIGDGEAHQDLRRLVEQLKLEEKVEFIESMANEQLCETLTDYDLFAVHNAYPGIPKTVMEALWLGLPVVINRDQVRPVPELSGEWLDRVDNTVEGYQGSLRRLLGDAQARAELGQRGRAYAEATFAPRQAEERQADVYRRLLASSPQEGDTATCPS